MMFMNYQRKTKMDYGKHVYKNNFSSGTWFLLKDVQGHQKLDTEFSEICRNPDINFSISYIMPTV